MVILNLLVKPIAIFGIDATVQNRVGAEAYGTYFSLLNFSFLFNILLDVGINNFTTKSVAQYPKAAVNYLGKVITFRFILFLIYAVFTVSIALILGWTDEELYLLVFLVFNQLFITLIAYARSHFGGLLMFKSDALISVLDRFLLILFCGAVLFLPITDQPFKIEWFVWIQTGCYALACIIAISMLIRKIGVPQIKPKRLFSYAIVRKSLPYALLILLMMIYTRTDSVMIERMHPDGKNQSGYYAQGFRLLDAFFMFAMLFSNLLFPMFSRMLAKKESITSLMQTGSKLLLGGAILIASVVCFNSYYILHWIYTSNLLESESIFILLMFAFIAMCTTLLFGTVLTANGNLKFLNITAGVGILVNISLNAILIPLYGAQGAAIATVSTQSAVALVQVGYTTWLFNWKINWTALGQLIGFAAFSFVIQYFLSVWNIWVFIGLICVQIGALFLFQLVNLKALKEVALSGGSEENSEQ